MGTTACSDGLLGWTDAAVVSWCVPLLVRVVYWWIDSPILIYWVRRDEWWSIIIRLDGCRGHFVMGTTACLDGLLGWTDTVVILWWVTLLVRMVYWCICILSYFLLGWIGGSQLEEVGYFSSGRVKIGKYHDNCAWNQYMHQSFVRSNTARVTSSILSLSGKEGGSKLE